MQRMRWGRILTACLFMVPTIQAASLNHFELLRLGDKSMDQKEWLEKQFDYYPEGALYKKVSLRYGPTVLDPQTLDGRIIKATSDVKPWSSYWFPSSNPLLFEGQDSPLFKYDLYVWRTKRIQTNAAGFEREQLYQPHAAVWEGHCDEWAFASLLTPEPKQTVVRGNIAFSVRDQKALLIKTFQHLKKSEIYGNRYDTIMDVPTDIYPDEFHRFVEVQMMQNRKAFIIDYDAGSEVWNVPVWRVQFKMVPHAHDPNIIQVESYVTIASQHVPDHNFVGTKEITKVYTYDLYTYTSVSGQLVVTHGRWTGGSRLDHPDFIVTLPEDSKGRKSDNKFLASELVDEIVYGPNNGSRRL